LTTQSYSRGSHEGTNTRANFEEQYFLNRCDRYWIINDAEQLANYFEDLAGSLLTGSDTSTVLNSIDLAYKSTKQLSWDQSVEFMKRQDRVLGYSHFITTKRFEDKDNMGVIEPRKYTEKLQIEETRSTELVKVQTEEEARNLAKERYGTNSYRALQDIRDVGISGTINKIKFERDIFNPDLSEVSKGTTTPSLQVTFM
jgi:hypothetical protein